MNDYYALLGLPRTADAREIRKAYRGRAKGCHPDLHPGDARAEEAFKALSEAYAILNDPGERAAYDRLNPQAGTRPPVAAPREPARAPWSHYGRDRKNWVPVDMASLLADRERRVRRNRRDRIIGLLFLAATAAMGLHLIFAPLRGTMTLELAALRVLPVLGLYFLILRPQLYRDF